MAKPTPSRSTGLSFDITQLSPKQLQELKERAEARLNESLIERCQALKAEFQERCSEEGLTLSQVFFEGKQGGIANAKYKDPISGKTWSGRGKKPSWLIGHEEKFAIS
jgi:DNA-binding protein H-NS